MNCFAKRSVHKRAEARNKEEKGVFWTPRGPFLPFRLPLEGRAVVELPSERGASMVML